MLNLYNSLQNFEKKIETGLALGVKDPNLGIEERSKLYLPMSVSEEIKQFKYPKNLIQLGRNIL